MIFVTTAFVSVFSPCKFLASTKTTVPLPEPCDFFQISTLKLKIKGSCCQVIEEIQTESQAVLNSTASSHGQAAVISVSMQKESSLKGMVVNKL